MAGAVAAFFLIAVFFSGPPATITPKRSCEGYSESPCQNQTSNDFLSPIFFYFFPRGLHENMTAYLAKLIGAKASRLQGLSKDLSRF